MYTYYMYTYNTIQYNTIPQYNTIQYSSIYSNSLFISPTMKKFLSKNQKYHEQVDIKDYAYKLQFADGIAIQNDLYTHPDHLLHSLKYTTCQRYLLHQLTSRLNLWLLFIILFSLIFQAIPQLVIALIQLALNFAIKTYNILLLLNQAQKQFHAYYSSIIYVHPPSHHLFFKVIKWDPYCKFVKTPKKNLQVGDLIFLKRNQQALTSFIILNSQEKQFLVQTHQRDGSSDQTSKKTLSIAGLAPQKIHSFQHYKHILTGKIAYDQLDNNSKHFRGFIKLQKDPNGEYLDYSNIVTSLSIIKNTDWVIGIVIDNDDQTIINIWQNLFDKQPYSKMELYFSRYAAIYAIFWIFGYTISVVQLLIFSHVPFYKNQQISNFEILSRVAQNLGMIQPSIILFFIEFFFLLLNRAFQGRPDCKLLDSSELLKLSDIDICVYDNTLTNSQSLLGGIICGGRFFSHEVAPIKKVSKANKFRRTNTVNNTNVVEPSVELISEQEQEQEEKDNAIEEQWEIPELNENLNKKIIVNIETKLLKKDFHRIEVLEEEKEEKQENQNENENENENEKEKEKEKENQNSNQNENQNQSQNQNENQNEEKDEGEEEGLLAPILKRNKQEQEEIPVSTREEESQRVNKKFLKKTRLDRRRIQENSPESMRSIMEESDKDVVEDSDIDESKTFQECVKEYHKKGNNLMKAFILCQDCLTKSNMNHTKLQSLMKNDYIKQFNSFLIHEGLDPYQEMINAYAFENDYKFCCAGMLNKRLVYEVEMKGLRVRYAVRKKVYRKDFFFMLFETVQQQVMRRNNAKELFVLAKSENMKLLDLCKMSAIKRIQIEKLIKEKQQSGFRFILYAGKPIEHQAIRINEGLGESVNYQILVPPPPPTDVHSTQHSNTLSEWDASLYEDLEFYGIACLKEQYNQGAKVVVDNMKEIDITQWMLSADRKMQTVSTCFQVGILQEGQNLLQIDEFDQDKLKLQIKTHLLYIRKQLLQQKEMLNQNDNKVLRKKSTFDQAMREMKNKNKEPLQDVALLVNGQSIQEISKDAYMKSHFLFIAMIVKTVIGYNCLPSDKMFLIEEISKIHSNILTITDSIDDMNMNRFATVNIQYQSGNNSEQEKNILQSKLQISNFQHIRQLMLEYPKLITMQIRSITIYFIKTCLTLYLFQVMQLSVTFNIYLELSVTYMIALLLQMMLVFTGYNHRSELEQMSVMLPMVIPEAYHKLRRNWKWIQEVVFEVMITSILNAIIASQIYQEFMLQPCLEYPYPRDVWSENDINFVIHSHLVMSLGISYMIYFNASKKIICLNLVLNAIIISLSMLIQVDPNLRTIIMNQCLSLQFLMGLGSIVIMLMLVDQMVKKLREGLFVEQAIGKFMSYVGLQIYQHRVLILKNLDKLKLETMSKISNKFFERISKVFEKVVVDQFIRSLVENNPNSAKHRFNPILLTYDNQLLEMNLRNKKFVTYFLNQRIMVVFIFTLSRTLILGLNPQLESNYEISINVLLFVMLAMWILFIVLSYLKGSLEPAVQIKVAKVDLYVILPLFMMLENSLRWFLQEKDIEKFYYDGVSQILQFQMIAWDIFPPPIVYPSAIIITFQIIYSFRNFYLIDITSEDEYDQIRIIIILCQVFLMTFLSIFTHYAYEKSFRLGFLSDETVKIQQEQTNQILKLLLPAFVYETMDDSNHFNLQENQGEVAVIFVEICNFDQILQSKQRQVVSYLDDIFRTFDKLCIFQGVQKIETVGKTYMACAGLKSVSNSNENCTHVAINLSFDFMSSISEFKYDFQGKTHKLKIKIGLHYGQVLAGVIGYHKPQFSLIGDTVNTASRMCSTGAENKITISHKAYEQVKDIESTYLFHEFQVYAKGKGTLTVYEVCKRQFRKLRSKTEVSEAIEITFLEKCLGSRLPCSKTQIQSSSRRSRVYSQKSGTNALLIKKKKKKNLNSSIIQPKRNSLHSQFSGRQEHRIQSAILPSNANDEPQEEEILQINYIEWYPERQMLQVQQPQGQNSDKNLGEASRNDQKKKKPKRHLEYNQWTLSTDNLNDDEIENQFEAFFADERRKSQVFFMSVVMFAHICKTHVHLLYRKNENEHIYYLVRVFLAFFCILLAFISDKVRKQKKYQIDMLLASSFYILLSVSTFLMSAALENDFMSLDAIEVYLIGFAAVNQQVMKFKYMFVYLLIQSIAWVSLLLIYGRYYACWFIMISSMILQAINYTNFKQVIINFNSITNENMKKELKDNLLTNLLPSHILTQFFQNNKIKLELSDELNQATLLFADIAGFTLFSSNVSHPVEVVHMLEHLMTQFDKECQTKNVYKVYTIGGNAFLSIPLDCYVVLGVTNIEQRQPGVEAKNVVDMGLAMVEIIRRVRIKLNLQNLHMRIGIHTGNFYGGITGTDIVRYDIFGTDAIIANKMESNGQPDRVMISEDTKVLIEMYYPDEYHYEKRQQPVIAAKKQVNAYFITPKVKEFEQQKFLEVQD